MRELVDLALEPAPNQTPALTGRLPKAIPAPSIATSFAPIGNLSLTGMGPAISVRSSLPEHPSFYATASPEFLAATQAFIQRSPAQTSSRHLAPEHEGVKVPLGDLIVVKPNDSSGNEGSGQSVAPAAAEDAEKSLAHARVATEPRDAHEEAAATESRDPLERILVEDPLAESPHSIETEDTPAHAEVSQAQPLRSPRATNDSGADGHREPLPGHAGREYEVQPERAARGPLVLELQPERLGAVKITVEAHGATVDASLEATDATLTTALQNNQSQLASSLEQRGFSLGHFVAMNALDAGSGGMHQDHGAASYDADPRAAQSRADAVITYQAPISDSRLVGRGLDLLI